MEKINKKVALIILDGVGLAPPSKGNAVFLADMKYFYSLLRDYPHSQLDPKGVAVGLPFKQMGNSEVGHLNIGVGRVVHQSLMKIDMAIEDGSFYSNKVLLNAINITKQKNSHLHIIGLMSEGGVHSHIHHLYGLLEMAKENGIKEVYIHAFLDGRDTAMKVGIQDIQKLDMACKSIGVGKIATITGRYYAMDRDKNWERIKIAYDALVLGKGRKASSLKEAVKEAYDNNETDEFISPIIMMENDVPVSTIKKDDSVIFINFRPDRARELSVALANPDFKEFERKVWNPILLTTLTEYDRNYSFPVAFHQTPIANPLGEILAKNGVHQLRAAETEKYAHVTFFFNAMMEEPYPLEKRILVPSPKVATYDLKPEMSACELTTCVIDEIDKGETGFLLLNYANPDMVGHSGMIDASIKALKTIDTCLKDLITCLKKNGFEILVTADHGNIEEMIDLEGNPSKTHSLNMVPFIYLPLNESEKDSITLIPGKLADVAPTVLDLFNIPTPIEMTGTSLIRRKK